MMIQYQRYISFVVFAFVALFASAQKATVERVEAALLDLSAKKYQRVDLNGDPCALVKVQVIADSVAFYGDVIPKGVERRIGEFWVYMMAGTKNLFVHSSVFLPVEIVFADYGIDMLQPNVTYVVTLSHPEVTVHQQPMPAKQAVPSEQGSSSVADTVTAEALQPDLNYTPFKNWRGKWGFKNDKGKIVVPAKYEQVEKFSEGLAAVMAADKWGFIDKNGTSAISARYDKVYRFSEGLAPVETDGKWGYVNREGKMVIQPQYMDALTFSEGLAPVETDGKWGYIDRAGNMVIPAKIHDIPGNFSEGLARVQVGLKYGFIDRTGNIVIPAEYSYAENFSDGISRVRVGNDHGFIDKEGNLVIPQDCMVWGDFSEGLAVAMKGYKKFGYIDKSGKFVIPAEFDYAWGFSGGKARVSRNGNTFYIDKDGAEVK